MMKNLLGACVDRGQTTIQGQSIFPHTLQKAAVLMHSIINFHPFVDGNKRVALLAVDFYLHWNGYKFIIPKDADDFTIKVAKDRLGLNDVLFWIEQNSIRTPVTVLLHWACESEMATIRGKHSQGLTESQRLVLFPIDAVRFFSAKILEKNRRLKQSTVDLSSSFTIGQ